MRKSQVEFEMQLSLGNRADRLVTHVIRQGPTSVLKKKRKTTINCTLFLSEKEKMVKKRRLLRGEVTYSWAKRDESNILVALEDYQKTVQYFTKLLKQSALIKEAAAHHLGISPGVCEPGPFQSWLYGSFNVCIPIYVHGHKKALMRFPILHRVGESFRPGNADEKIRCEAGTYAWLEKNCPSIPIPKLHGFVLSTGQSVRFTAWGMLDI